MALRHRYELLKWEINFHNTPLLLLYLLYKKLFLIYLTFYCFFHRSWQVSFRIGSLLPIDLCKISRSKSTSAGPLPPFPIHPTTNTLLRCWGIPKYCESNILHARLYPSSARELSKNLRESEFNYHLLLSPNQKVVLQLPHYIL